ncbi:hypothetical protein [Flavobacterium sp.]|uniref:hypothetical protein n=3 Tax=Bacteroidota TaxID=976 RepID=UPI00404970EC
MKTITIILIQLIMVLSILNTVSHLEVSHTSIVGTWVSENDAKSKWVFSSDGKCMKYNGNEIIGRYSYKLSDSTFQCGETVKKIKNVSFLSLSDVEDNSQYCYYLEGLTEVRMTLNPFNSSKFFTYKRQ